MQRKTKASQAKPRPAKPSLSDAEPRQARRRKKPSQAIRRKKKTSSHGPVVLFFVWRGSAALFAWLRSKASQARHDRAEPSRARPSQTKKETEPSHTQEKKKVEPRARFFFSSSGLARLLSSCGFAQKQAKISQARHDRAEPSRARPSQTKKETEPSHTQEKKKVEPRARFFFSSSGLARLLSSCGFAQKQAKISQARHDRAEPSRARPSQTKKETEPSHTQEKKKVEPRARFFFSSSGLARLLSSCGVAQKHAKPGPAEPSRAKATTSQAKPSRAEPSQTKKKTEPSQTKKTKTWARLRGYLLLPETGGSVIKPYIKRLGLSSFPRLPLCRARPPQNSRKPPLD